VLLAKVVGTVVATRKDPRLVSNKLLIARPMDPRGKAEGGYLVAVDTVDAGVGETVLIVSGSSARMASGMKDCPVDAAVVGIIDTVAVTAGLHWSRPWSQMQGMPRRFAIGEAYAHLVHLEHTGHIVNKGSHTVTGITVQVLFRNSAQEVAQNDPPQQMKFIRTRDPYIDVEPISAAPLKPGAERDFRLIFDAVTPDWDGAYPQVRILHVQTQ